MKTNSIVFEKQLYRDKKYSGFQHKQLAAFQKSMNISLYAETVNQFRRSKSGFLRGVIKSFGRRLVIADITPIDVRTEGQATLKTFVDVDFCHSID